MRDGAPRPSVGPGPRSAWIALLVALTAAACGGDSGSASSSADTEPRPRLASPGELATDRGDDLQTVRDEGSGSVVVLYSASEGWAYRDEEGHLTGVTIEILRDFFDWIREEEGVELEVTWEEDEEWNRFYRRVRNSPGGVIGSGNVTMTEERREELDFSPAYADNVGVLITHEDVPELVSMARAEEAFRDFVAHPYRGTLHEERVNRLRERRIPGLRVLPLESNDEILEAVATEPNRLAWIDIYAYWRAVEEGMPLRRHPAGDDASETLGFILPRGSDWTPALERFFEADGGYRNMDRYRELLETHLGEGLTLLLEETRTPDTTTDAHESDPDT
ncbi:MAG: ABC transporter substrate-binding protein [Gemmatimonadales bacterium]|nr:MAG: ABC transporter substrate-binding protein [Gemmatimonadales bacterium]